MDSDLQAQPGGRKTLLLSEHLCPVRSENGREKMQKVNMKINAGRL